MFTARLHYSMESPTANCAYRAIADRLALAYCTPRLGTSLNDSKAK